MSEPREYCASCHDTGYQPFWCPGRPETQSTMLRRRTRACPKTMAHYAHSFVIACPCVETNPRLAKERAIQAQRVARRFAKRKP